VLTPTTEVILGMLLKRSPRTAADLSARSNGFLAMGTVYVTIQRMEKAGLVKSKLEPRDPHRSGIRRRLYRATPKGRHLYNHWRKVRAELVR
jgi:DNA-binding PadR family transcriptional regulator